ncbi:MAG: FAD-dependent oxidoreductase [Pseudomonadota bacterium]|nr:FAD-dependent oxidoreductase [Pseudomonadota bacterium]
MAQDLIIVGAGIAGLSTAVQAVQNGLKPLVLEKGKTPDYPCNSRWSGGVIHVAEKDLRAPKNDIAAKIKDLVGSENSLALIMAEDAGGLLDWLRDRGAKFVKGGAVEFMRWVLAPPRPRRPGLDWKGRGPDVLLRKLMSAVVAGGGVIEHGVRGRALIVEDGEIVGLRAEQDGSSVEYRASAVVICDGGFQADPNLLRKYIGSKPDALFTRGAGTGCGDGLRMAENVGAKLIGMDRFYGHLLGREAFKNEKLWPYPTADAIARSSILIDKNGKRFLDEGKGGIYLANEIAKLEDPLSIAVVFDNAVWTGLAADNRYPPCMNPAFVNEGGTVFVADTIEDLAEQLGVPADALSKTVTAYNAAIESDTTAKLSPTRTATVVPAQPIRTAPFHAIELCVGITYTMGGIAIDSQSRVLDTDGFPIPGLFAAGSATGGIEGGPNAAYLGGLSKGVITGRRAAESISNAR